MRVTVSIPHCIAIQLGYRAWFDAAQTWTGLRVWWDWRTVGGFSTHWQDRIYGKLKARA